MAETKICSKCGVEKPLDGFYRCKSGKQAGYVLPECRACRLARFKAWRDANPEKWHTSYKQNRIRLRNLVLDHYGGKCACCGEAEKVFLCIDHINGGGQRHRKTVGWGSGFYRWVIKNNFPDDLQILCHNCNAAKELTEVCPHKLAGKEV